MHFAKGGVVVSLDALQDEDSNRQREEEEVVDEVPNLLPPLGCFLSSSYSSFALSTT